MSNIEKIPKDVDPEKAVEEELKKQEDKAQFSKESSENSAHLKEERLMKKAKRPIKDQQGVVQFATHHRRSRNRHGKGKPGQPKKGGAGGKGVWGKLGVELGESGDCRDINDPNYDSDTQGDYKLVPMQPEMNEEDLEKAIKPILKEYLEHGNTHEVEESLYDLNIPPHDNYKVLALAVQLGLERHNNQRELISQLISDLYNNILAENDIIKGFDELLNSIEDLRLDTPEAPGIVGQFIARAIADDCLAPKFINNYKGKVTNEYIKESLDKSHVLITMKQGMAHLDDIWSVGGGNRPVKYLTNKMIALIKEFLDSGDTKEALRCLKELEVPHFHHELVYQALDIAIEDSTEQVMNIITSLLKFFTLETLVITMEQFDKGVKRVCDNLGDISIDVPNAPNLFEEMCKKLKENKILSQAVYDEVLSRGRKRFVSEGDGGKIKH